MMTTQTAVDGDFNNGRGLVKLSESTLTVVTTDEDIRNRSVHDVHGEDLGTVRDLIVDEAEQKVRFVQVAQGGFLGIGQQTVLLPVDTIVRVAEREVHVDQDQHRIAGAPAYNPDLTDERYYEDLYGYYGVGPFWSAGYLYPPYPYYP